MKIPFSSPNIGQKEKEYLNQAINSGWIGSSGDFIDRFEAKFAKFIGVEYAITCSSGTTALMLAYHACGMNATAKVVAPDTTFIATVNMARMFTADIQLHEVDQETWTIPLKDIKANCVVGVHLYGNPCDMGDIYKHKFTFIEDCAQSLGSKFKGKMTGSYGLASCFSFHSAKTITTGEGGMVCTNNETIAKRVRHLKNHSMVEPYQHDMIGYNARMTNLQASIGLAQLERIDELMDRKRAITKYYEDNLSKSYIRQKPQRNSHLVKWANAFKHPRSKEIRSQLFKSGIETRPGFIGDDTICLPCSTTLTSTELSYIVSTLNAYA